MSHRFAALVVVLGAFVSIASLAALWVGVTDYMVASSGPKRRAAAAELSPGARGWYGVDGCVRHDLAVVVTAENVVYRLGERGPAPDEGDRTYTPLAAIDDCDEDKPPRHVYAIVEDQETTETTLGRTGPRLIAPPPIAAHVDGTIGPRVGDRSRLRRAQRRMPADTPGLAEAPLLRKNGRPGDRGVALFTAAAGLHGLLLLALGARWILRRRRLRDAIRSGEHDEQEAEFFRTETLD